MTGTNTLTKAELSFSDNRFASELYGDLNRNLIALEKSLDIQIQARGTSLVIQGQGHAVRLSQSLLNQLYSLISEGYPVYPQDVAYGLRILEKTPQARLKDIFLDKIYITASHGVVSPKSVNQKDYIEAIRNHDIVFGIGPAGTGKTYLAVAMAVSAYTGRHVENIILARPAVEAGEKLGFLPGDLAQKINPYLRPLYDALYDMLGREKTAQLVENGTIEIAPLAFMRGRTLNNAFVILDEAQNTTKEQMKMFLTRLGFGSKAVITGDITQIDLPTNQHSGLVNAVKILKKIKGLSFNYFSDADVVRHPLVQQIIRAYDPTKKQPSLKKSQGK